MNARLAKPIPPIWFIPGRDLDLAQISAAAASAPECIIPRLESVAAHHCDVSDCGFSDIAGSPSGARTMMRGEQAAAMVWPAPLPPVSPAFFATRRAP
jgi:hypothetical protein